MAIISQPDKPANRGYKLQYTPTKILAEKYQIKVYQPEKIIDIYEELKSYDYDILLSCAFGQFIPTKVLELAKKGSLNIHGSLLPKYRGAAPIQHSLLNGDDVTGICLIYMVNKMDAGDIIFEKSINIDLKDTSETLFKKLSSLSAENIVKLLEDFYNGNFKIKKQNEDLVTFF
ncbi:methionyl-tRNA formyltransferase [Mycoplasmopsis cynos]|uniref:methionyl-tRNA formyltransferase n=1 Tax=Mycoplasmopsis cynos TaxID=171284 RepID=UPI003A5C7A53